MNGQFEQKFYNQRKYDGGVGRPFFTQRIGVREIKEDFPPFLVEIILKLGVGEIYVSKVDPAVRVTYERLTGSKYDYTIQEVTELYCQLGILKLDVGDLASAVIACLAGCEDVVGVNVVWGQTLVVWSKLICSRVAEAYYNAEHYIRILETMKFEENRKPFEKLQIPPSLIVTPTAEAEIYKTELQNKLEHLKSEKTAFFEAVAPFVQSIDPDFTPEAREIKIFIEKRLEGGQ